LKPSAARSTVRNPELTVFYGSFPFFESLSRETHRSSQ
jgi:hypothetical protein